jgi:hypothetical protein
LSHGFDERVNCEPLPEVPYSVFIGKAEHIAQSLSRMSQLRERLLRKKKQKCIFTWLVDCANCQFYTTSIRVNEFAESY